jgi:hypothetical protein
MNKLNVIPLHKAVALVTQAPHRATTRLQAEQGRAHGQDFRKHRTHCTSTENDINKLNANAVKHLGDLLLSKGRDLKQAGGKDGRCTRSALSTQHTRKHLL